MRKHGKDLIEIQEVRKEFTALAEHVKERPWHYAVGGAVILVCAVAGLLYMSSSAASTREASTRLATALNEEDPATRMARLQEITDLRSGVQPLTLYLAGEAAFELRQFAEAKELFETLRQKFPNAAQTPDAVEGLGSILEAEGADYAGAIGRYEEVMSTWPESFAALRQPLNIARCLDAQGDTEGAIARYREQIEMFPESSASDKAQIALDRLTAVETAPSADVLAAEPTPAPGEEIAPTTPALTLQIPDPQGGENAEEAVIEAETLTIPGISGDTTPEEEAVPAEDAPTTDVDAAPEAEPAE